MGLMNGLMPVILALAAAGIGSFGQLALKLGMVRSAQTRLPAWRNRHLYVGVFLYAVATVVFVYALRFGQVTTLYPVIASSYIWTSLLAARYLGERMNPLKWAGIVFIVAGIPFLAVR